MAIETMTLSHLSANLGATLSECADSGRVLVVELPDNRFVSIQPVHGLAENLTDKLLETNDRFRQLVADSAASTRTLLDLDPASENSAEEN